MEEVDIPSFFICPISLQMMHDPVTVSTGMTYDRESIERWLFSGRNRTCPVTRQPLLELDLTPNHTLRRLIQSWCAANASSGIERIPTPRPPVDRTQIVKLVDEARRSPKLLVASLQKLKEIALASERNKRCMEATGAAHFLINIIRKASASPEEFDTDMAKAGEEAISILHSIDMTEEGLRELVTRNGDLINILIQVLRRKNCHSRIYAVFLMKSILEVLDPENLLGIKSEVFIEVVQVLRDQISQQATKAALQILVQLCPWGRNRVKAAEARAVTALVELMLDLIEKRTCEMVLVVLDQLCGCAEGRAELLGHAAALSLVSKKMMRVSMVGTERAVRIFLSIAKFSATPSVLQEMLQVGIVGKLCMVLQLDCSNKTKEKAREILVMHSRVWRSSSCVPLYLQASYPSHL